MRSYKILENLDLEALDLNRSEILFESSEGRVPVRVLRDFVCSPFVAAATFGRAVKWLIPCRQFTIGVTKDGSDGA
jgi:hypothetical protein